MLLKWLVSMWKYLIYGQEWLSNNNINIVNSLERSAKRNTTSGGESVCTVEDEVSAVAFLLGISSAFDYCSVF